MLLRESMGISADATSRAFPSADVEAFMKRTDLRIPDDYFAVHESRTHHIVLAVDPAGGGGSQFAVCSVAMMLNGTVMVRHSG